MRHPEQWNMMIYTQNMLDSDVMDFEVLITGGSRGIGKEIVNIYSRAGYKIYAPSRDELDLADPSSVERFIVGNSHRFFGIIINNAGVNHINTIENIVDEDLDDMMNINLLSPLRLIRGFVPNMKNHKFGRIVNVGSIWGIISKPGRAGYSVTKHGIHGLTKTLALELAADGILVNTVAPGQTMTELTMRNNSAKEIEQMERDIPIGRLADPDEIARVVFFLGNEDNTYITGQELVVDGGLSIQ